MIHDIQKIAKTSQPHNERCSAIEINILTREKEKEINRKQ